MSKARPQILSLNGGEVDGEAIARSDLDSYANKAQVIENALLAVKGGLFRAPGTRFLGYTLHAAGDYQPTIVRTWRYSREQAFVLAIAPYAVRIIYDTGFIQTGLGAASFASSWSDDSDGGSIGGEPTWPNPPAGGASVDDYDDPPFVEESSR
jgi:hypothetical protein